MWHHRVFNRRQFLMRGTASLTGITALHISTGRNLPAGDPTPVVFEGRSPQELQAAMFSLGKAGGILRLASPKTIICPAREDTIEGELSRHPLLIPPGVQLDLMGGTLQLNLLSNCYGVRLSNHSAIRNGTIEVIHSEGKGSQGCWHSAISIGAAYGDGGTPQQPGKFSRVAHWSIENMTIDQRVEASAIQLMSEACHGTIRNVTIIDSPRALLGIGMDWGSVGPITSADTELPRMQQFWKQKAIYSTHPHDITIENVKIGKLTRNIDANDAGIRCSACHRITIRNVEIESAATAVAIWGGDCGYEFAPQELRAIGHSGYVIENVSINEAQRFGIVLNGTADNVVRASRTGTYSPLIDPALPGIQHPVIKNVQLHAGLNPQSQGIYAVAVTGAELEALEITGFGTGVHVEDWVKGMTFRNCQLAMNLKNTRIEGATVPATGVRFDPPVE